MKKYKYTASARGDAKRSLKMAEVVESYGWWKINSPTCNSKIKEYIHRYLVMDRIEKYGTQDSTMLEQCWNYQSRGIPETGKPP